MVRHRDAAALTSFFVAQGHRWCRRLRVVVTDGSESYRAAIGAHVGHATHVVDRFHVVRWFAAGLVEVRRRIQRREPRGHVQPAFDPEVFRNRFLALRRADRLTDAEQLRLQALFAAHAELARAWAMLQELHGLYLADDEEQAMAALDRFAGLYTEDPLPEFYKVVDTLLNGPRRSSPSTAPGGSATAASKARTTSSACSSAWRSASSTPSTSRRGGSCSAHPGRLLHDLDPNDSRSLVFSP